MKEGPVAKILKLQRLDADLSSVVIMEPAISLTSCDSASCNGR